MILLVYTLPIHSFEFLKVVQQVLWDKTEEEKDWVFSLLPSFETNLIIGLIVMILCGWNVIIQPFTKVTWMDSKIKKNVFIVCYSRMKIVNKGSISNVKNNTIDDWMTMKYLFQVQRQSFQAHSKKAGSFLSWFYFAVSSTAFWKEVYFPRMRRKSSFSDLNSDSDVSNSCF